MKMHAWTRKLLIAMTLLLCAGCGVDSYILRQLPQYHGFGNSSPTGWQAAIPVPSSLPHGATACSMNAEQGGDGYELGLPYNNCNQVGGTDGEFLPSWWQGAAVSNLAYCIYAFDTAGYSGPLHFTWDWSWLESGYDISTSWIGFANQSSQTWDFFQGSTSGNVNVPASADYTSGGGQVFILVVAASDHAGILDWVRLDGAVTIPGEKLFFLHHSTGAGLVFEGDMRGAIATFNSTNSTNYRFWDQGYNGDGVTDPEGGWSATVYNVPGDNTDPDGLHYLWTSSDADAVACRNGFLNEYDVIAFKSCFPASHIADAAELQQRKDWYLEMRDFFDTRTDKLFVVMSTPPLRDTDSTNATEAANARAFAEWLKSGTYLSGHPNVVCFDLFDALAEPALSANDPNMLREEYEIPGDDGNSHPNATANSIVGPQFAEFLCNAAMTYWLAD